MADNGQANEVAKAAPAVFEIIIQWVPAQGRLQVAGSQVDEVTKMGMLEMAKSVILAQAQGQRTSSPLIVPGRFAS